MEEKLSEAIKNAIEGAPERKFVEAMDISFTIKDVDLKNPNNRIQEEIRLPSGRGKEIKVAMSPRKKIRKVTTWSCRSPESVKVMNDI